MSQKKFLLNSLKELFQKELKIKVNIESKFLDFKSWDSLGNFNILLACEKKYKIKFTSNEFTSLNKFKEILKVVEKKIKKRR